jgi:hypothetical protein
VIGNVPLGVLSSDPRNPDEPGACRKDGVHWSTETHAPQTVIFINFAKAT